MKKVKYFEKYRKNINGRYEVVELDFQINEFLEENKYELIDVKLQVFIDDVCFTHESAMLIYSDGKNEY